MCVCSCGKRFSLRILKIDKSTNTFLLSLNEPFNLECPTKVTDRARIKLESY